MIWKTALVTGGAGFIGTHIVEELITKNLAELVISVDNLSTGKISNLEHLAHLNIRNIRCDVTDYIALSKIFETFKPDVVFHNSASKKTISMTNPPRDLDVNAKGTYYLLDLSRLHGVQKFVHASTGSVYGEPIIFPQTEDHPLHPVSHYGVSKLAGERYVDLFHTLFNMDTTILRYFHVFGPRQDHSDKGGVISIFSKKVLNKEAPTVYGDGTQERSFTYVDDVVRANILSATDPRATGEVYNCASGVSITVNEMLAKIIEIAGIDVSANYEDWAIGDIKHFHVDNSKLCDLGFEFKTDFSTGLRETIDWMRDEIDGGRVQ